MNNTLYTVRNYDVDNSSEFNIVLEKLHKEFPFSDIFIANDPIEIKTHIHTDCESRLFIKGFATFKIQNTEIFCGPGTYIYIDKQIPHSFSYNGGDSLKVIRFFKTNENWKAIYLGDSNAE